MEAENAMKSMLLRSLWSVGSIAILSLLPALVSCSDDRSATLHLLVAPTPKRQLTTEQKWLHDQQMVTILKAGGAVAEIDATEFSSDVLASCQQRVTTHRDVNEAISSGDYTCFDDYLYVDQAQICVAKTLLAAATVQAQPLAMVGADGSGYSIPRQSEATAEALAESAISAAKQALSMVTSDVTYPKYCATSQLVSWENEISSPPYSWGDRIVYAYAEALQTARDAYDRAVEASVNASDKMRSSSVSLTQSTERQISGEALSRAAAAHLLVGGDPGLEGSVENALCIHGDLVPSSKSALQLMRDAAVDPADVIDDSVTDDDLIDGSLANGSVRDRLAQFHHYPELVDKTKTVEQLYKLNPADFQEARRYLKEEIHAFSRLSKAQIDVPASSAGPFKRFAGTGEPKELPPSAWAAMARFNASSPDSGGLNGMLGEAHSFAKDVINPQNSVPISADVKDRAMAPFALFEAGQEVDGSVVISNAPDLVRGTVLEHYQAERLRIVVGEEGLRCAVQGSIEGADCGELSANPPAYPCSANATGGRPSLECLTLLKFDGPDVPTYTGISYLIPTNALFQGLPLTAALPPTRLYLVRPRDAGSPELPGNFEVLAGISSPASNNSVTVNIIPGLERRVGEVLAPSTQSCSIPRVSCAGPEIDARLPLEDELANDNDGVESSWRHYLDLAKQAAAEADLLGQDFIASSQSLMSTQVEAQVRQEEQEQRAEDMLQQVQSDCGTAIDSKKLLSLISGGDGTTINLSADLQSSCSATGPNCASGYSCVAGRCIVSFQSLANLHAKDPDFVRLASCLDTTQQFPFVTLGDKDLCVWLTPGNSNLTCPSAVGECPSIAPAPPTGPGLHAPRCVKTVNGVTYPGALATALSKFVRDRNDSIDPSACNAIRRLRAHPEDMEARERMIGGGVLDPAKVRSALAHLAWNAKYGGFADVVADTQTVYTTGSLTAGPSNVWPCAARTSACADPSGMAGLLCTNVDCTNDLARTQMNERLLRATLAASIMLSRTGKSWTDLASSVSLTVPVQSFGPIGDLSQCNDRPTATDFFWSDNAPVVHGCSWYSQRTGASDIGWFTSDGRPMHANSAGQLSFLSTSKNDPFYIQGPSRVAFASLGFTGTVPTDDAQQYLWGGLSSFGGTGQVRAALLHNIEPDALVRFQPTINFSYGFLSGAIMPIPSVGGADFLDGLEILCDASIAKTTGTSLKPADLATFENLEAAGEYLKTLSASLIDKAGRMVFARIPKAAVDMDRATAGIGAFPQLGGKMAVQVSALRTAFLQAESAVPTIAGEMNAFGSELKALRAALEKGILTGKITDVQLSSTIADRLDQCAESMNAGKAISSFGFGVAAACANAAAQIVFASQLNDLQHQAAAQDDVIAKEDFAGKASQHARALQIAAISLSEAAEQIDSAAAEIEGLKKDAQVDLARAVYMASSQAQLQSAQMTAIGTLATAKQARYKEAFSSARQMVFLAKRAIEQRLGVQLSSMTDDLPLVQAPQKWEGHLCTMSGIDFASLDDFAGFTDPTKVKFSSDPASYSDGFLGDYVTKLANLVESYRLQNNFHEGSDVAIVSLRDDVLNVRAKCDVPSSNLLLQSATLDHPIWQPKNCVQVNFNGVSQLMNCVRAVPLLDPTTHLPVRPFLTADNELSGATGYTLQFGDGLTPRCQAGSAAGPCSWQPGSALEQEVTLQPGKYRLTWYTKESYASLVSPHSAGARAAHVMGPSSELSLNYQTEKPASGSTWSRQIATFTVPSPLPGASSVYRVGFVGQTCTSGIGNVLTCNMETSVPNFQFTIAAPMLEQVPSTGPETELRSFQRTGDDATVQLQVCEDTDGAIFRSAESGIWKRECVRLCDAGFSNNCTDGPVHCYRKAEFGVSQSAIQNGKIFNFSGFARGNFNYRIDQLALNVVGTGIRDCADSKTPSTCNGGGFLNYSFDHTGPFFVRNFDGGDYRAFLFDGHIEQARALASERYITNPLGSADRSLLSDYERKELQGRPLDGNFAIRIWEDPSVNFDAIQDVQLVLNYSYWTRFK